MASASGNVRRGGRLKSWKEIAAFFGADERTVRRWEARGLPVRRLPGGGRATVYADVAELETWMRGRDDVLPSAAGDAPVPSARRRRRAAFVAGIAAVAAAGVAFIAFAPGGSSGAPAAPHRPPQQAVDLYLTATYDWEKRTPESLRQARDLFGRAIAEDPAYAEAYAGLANTYLLLREYSGMPDSEAYPRAREAAERALSLNPNLADAHSALAFVTFFWTRDWPRALEGFRRATALDPSSASAWHWYGTALLHAGRPDQALAALDQAQQREPSSRSIVADKALAAYYDGRGVEAVATLRQLVASDPEFSSPHAYLAQIYFVEGDFASWLRETAIAARLKGNPDEGEAVARAQQGLRAGGRDRMLRVMLADETGLRRTGRGSDYRLATLHAALGEKEPALRLLAASDRGGESAFVWVRMDRNFRSLADDPRFRQLAADVERPPPGRA
ncbi:MAG TPA: tetratricopeptide repeat protein [Allosphingosinicella sp.]|nr:tetratricopeptide repeat protein [Allosphingosinicella sp.]